MTAITLELAKQHLRIDGTEEDELLALYIAGAEQWAENYLDRKLAEFDPLPADLKLAILRLVAFHYEWRNIAEAARAHMIAPQNIAQVLDAYRKDHFGHG